MNIKNHPLKYLMFFVILVILAVFIIQSRDSVLIFAPKGTISVEIAATESAREHGLSDRNSLGQTKGILFVFPDSRIPSFWMKDMHFPIDIVWIDSTDIVVDITKNISTTTYPQTFSPKVPIKYVLELNAGASEKFGIEVGKNLEISVDK